MTIGVGPAQRRVLEQSLRERAFRPVLVRERPLIGAEAELIPVYVVTRTVSQIDGPVRTTTLGMLRDAAGPGGWREHLSAKGTPQFAIPGGGTLGFEPGGHHLELMAR